jgi:hypothetical protein
VLLTALLAVAYLLGREAGRTEHIATGVGTEALAGSVEPTLTARAVPQQAPRPQAPPESAAVADPAPAPRVPPLTVTATSRVALPEPATPDAPPLDQADRAAVARYFDEVDQIAGNSGGAGDPEALAMAMLTQATGGDWRQFDELGETQRTTLRRLRSVRVPPPCREYHQKMVTLLEAGADLLDTVKEGVQSGSLTALSTLATTAQRLQTDAEEARRMADALQRRYGL